MLRSRTDKFEQKFSLCADLVKALVRAAIILPCCLWLFDFFTYVLPLCLVNKVEYIAWTYSSRGETVSLRHQRLEVLSVDTRVSVVVDRPVTQ